MPDTAIADTPLLAMRDVGQIYRKRDTADLHVLEDVSMTLRTGEIVGLLGRSGSGKSSLLRIIAGLATPSSGEVLWQGRPMSGPPDGVSMVFQSFALFPWLTVLENVQLGLEARNVPTADARRRALTAIDLIGLDGFESAYPKELSGGMRQRVGFARAMVVKPQLLLMDEPFSALDVLTAETLRTDMIDLWIEGRLPAKSVLIVTHNIEEAVLLCDRILMFSSNPGRIAAEIKVDLPHPRRRTAPAFRQLVDDIYARMTKRTPDGAVERHAPDGIPGTGLGMILPPIGTNELAGLLETLATAPYDGKADLPRLAEALQMDGQELFPMAETLQLLRFAEVEEGDIRLTDPGRRFVESEVDGRKRLFAEHLVKYVPLATVIKRTLDDRSSHRASLTLFSEELQEFMSEEAAETALRAVIAWGRYAELFAYDEQTQKFSLENPA